MLGIKNIFSKYLTFGDAPTDAIMVNNAEWLDNLNYIDFLRNYGRHFTINRMLKFDSVKLRLDREQPLSFLEFNYMILQAYDFLELARRYNCQMQMGGSDQWGNIINGVELGRRVDQTSLFGLTSPLLTSASDAKMGKTADGAIWLDNSSSHSDFQTSAYEFWQYWRNTEDRDVGRFLRLFTELPLEEIVKLETLAGAELNEAKKVLATSVTAMCHGQLAADEAALTAQQTFEGGGASLNLKTYQLPLSDLESGIKAIEILSLTGMAKSRGEARKLIKGGGCRVNDVIVENEVQIVKSEDINNDGVIKLSAGKKRHMLIRPI
jgi:tyrosyl-tRNA synthetase